MILQNETIMLIIIKIKTKKLPVFKALTCCNLSAI